MDAYIPTHFAAIQKGSNPQRPLLVSEDDLKNYIYKKAKELTKEATVKIKTAWDIFFSWVTNTLKKAFDSLSVDVIKFIAKWLWGVI